MSLYPSFRLFFVRLLRPPPTSTLFPYTTLFRSQPGRQRPPGRPPPGAGDRPPRPSLGPPRVRRRVGRRCDETGSRADRKSTRLNSSHGSISYAVFCLKKKKKKNTTDYHTT